MAGEMAVQPPNFSKVQGLSSGSRYLHCHDAVTYGQWSWFSQDRKVTVTKSMGQSMNILYKYFKGQPASLLHWIGSYDGRVFDNTQPVGRWIRPVRPSTTNLNPVSDGLPHANANDDDTIPSEMTSISKPSRYEAIISSAFEVTTVPLVAARM